MPDLALRPATHGDADLLLSWRNDPLTRKNSHQQQVIAPDEHSAWLQQALANDHVTLLIAEEGGRPVGTVIWRLSPDGATILSWTIAPDARGRGLAKRMVRTVVSDSLHNRYVRAEVKEHNQASISVAQAAGLSLISEEDGVLTFERAPGR